LALNEADCATLTQALANTQAAGSFNISQFSLRLGGAGGTSTGNELSLRGTGPVLLNEAGGIGALQLAVAEASASAATPPGQIIWYEEMAYIGTPDESTGELAWTGAPTTSEDSQALLNILSGNVLLQALSAPNVAVTLRGEDAELNGQAMQVFQSEIDFITLLLTPGILELLETLLAASADVTGDEGGGFGLDQFGGDLEGAIPLLGLLLTKDTVTAETWVGEDGQIYRVAFLVDVVIDPSAFDPSQSPISFLFEVQADLDQHGAAFEITPPAAFEAQEAFSFDLGGLGDMTGAAAAPSAPATPAPDLSVEAEITPGQAVSGTLNDDNTLDVWGWQGEAGQGVTITMRAASNESILDTRLSLLGPDGEILAENDDHGTDREDLMFFDSLIAGFTLPADGEYRIIATWLTPVQDGAYELSLEVAP
jgi:hypothetical protein